MKVLRGKGGMEHKLPDIKEYYVGDSTLRHATPESMFRCLSDRLHAGDETAPFCRGYLFALEEQGRITADAGDDIMWEVARHPGRGEQWLAGFPREQSHPVQGILNRPSYAAALAALLEDID